MAEEKSDSPVTPDIARQHRDNRRRYSTGQGSIAKGEENAAPNYLRASTGSCHDICKYGMKHAHETKTRTFMLRRIPNRLHDDPILVKSVELPSRKNALARRLKSSSGSKSLTLDSPDINQKHLSTPDTQTSVQTQKKKISAENALLPDQKRKLAANSKVAGSKSLIVDSSNITWKHLSTPDTKNSVETGKKKISAKDALLPDRNSKLATKSKVAGSKSLKINSGTNVNQKIKQKGSIPVRQNSVEAKGSAERKEKSAKPKPSLGLKTHSSGAKETDRQEISSSCEASKQVPLKVKGRRLSGMHSASTNHNHKGLKQSPPSITSIWLNKRRSSDSAAERIRESPRRISAKNLVVPRTALVSSNSSVRKVPSLTGKNGRIWKGVSHERNESNTENFVAVEMDNEEVPEKTLYVINMKSENEVTHFEATGDALTSNNHNQNGASIATPTSSHHSANESAFSRDLQSVLFEGDPAEQAKLCVNDEKACIDAISIPLPLSSPESLSLGDFHSSSSHKEDPVEQAKLCENSGKASTDAVSIPKPLSSPETLSLVDSHSPSLREEDQTKQAKLCINDEKASIDAMSIPQALPSPDSLSLGDSHSSSLHEVDQAELAESQNCNQSERNFESSPSHPNSSSLSSSHEEEKEGEDAEEDEEEEELESEYSISESEDYSISDGSDTDVLEKTEILEGEKKGKEKKSGVVYTKDVDGKPVKLHFRRGSVVEIEAGNNAPRRLKFRRSYSVNESEDYSASDGSDMDVLEKKEIVEGENKGKEKKSGVVYAKDGDGKPVKLHFRRGRVVEIQTENNAPRRLKFRQGRVLDASESLKLDAQRRSIKQREEADGDNDGTKMGSKKVVLRRKGVQEKKNSKGLFNNVIEETASKLVETRKSKVKALVGAFETVISLQDTKPSAS